jgi:hypothetical protein
MLTAAGMALPAAAADLGGNCCADLEERVAELEATAARKGNRKVSLTISGQVTTALMAWDDGDRSDVYVVDPPNVGGSFFLLSGDAKINPKVTAGFAIQIGLDFGSRAHQVTSKDDDGTNGLGSPASNGSGDSLLVLTLANWYLDHKDLGRVTVGRINTATAGITGLDLGGAGVIANVNLGYWQRSFDAVGTGVTWNTLLGGGTVNGSTLSRANAISYTSPTAGGFSFSAAAGEDDVWDVALRYAGEHSGFRVVAGVGYISNSSGLNEVTDSFGVTPGTFTDGAEPSVWKGSASVLHVATGLYLSGAYLNQDNDNGSDTRLWYLNGGIAKNWTGLGNTVLYGEYGRVDDGVRVADPDSSSEATVWGLGIVQHIDAAAMELFLAYRNFSGEADFRGERGRENAEDMDVVMGGARIRF